MTANEKTNLLRAQIERCTGKIIGHIAANTVRRAALVLHRWAELECGDGNGFASWAIERDAQTGRPFLCCYPRDDRMRRRPVADRERGALQRVAAVCAAAGLYFYHQTDPRGASLYVAAQPLTDSDYDRGVAV